MGQKTNMYIVYISISLVLFGAGNTLIYKYQDKQVVQADGKRFIHPFMQTFMSFFGEFLCLLMFFFSTRMSQKAVEEYARRKEEAEEQGLETKVSK